MLPLEQRLNAFSEKNSISIISKISKGYSSEIYKAKDRNGMLLAVKIERDKSKRHCMCLKESENLKLANSVSVGPKLFFSDFENRAIAMEFIDGQTMNRWLFEGKPSKQQLRHFLYSLFLQAQRLDSIGLSHGQLGGKGKNILVLKKGCFCEPVIIDFEKASTTRKARNTKQLAGMLLTNKHSAIAKKIMEILAS